MNSLDDDKKISVLLAALSERYESMRTIRARVQDVCLWISGILLASAGWLIATDIVLTCVQTIALLLALGLMVGILQFVYLSDLQKGFRGQQRVASRIERALKLYDHKLYDDAPDGIYPASWINAGGRAGKGAYFGTSLVLIFTTATFLATTIAFKGYESGMRLKEQDRYEVVGRTDVYSNSSDSQHDVVHLVLKHRDYKIEAECDLKTLDRLDPSATCALRPLRRYDCALGNVDSTDRMPMSDLMCRDANGHSVYLYVQKLE